MTVLALHNYVQRYTGWFICNKKIYETFHVNLEKKCLKSVQDQVNQAYGHKCATVCTGAAASEFCILTT